MQNIEYTQELKNSKVMDHLWEIIRTVNKWYPRGDSFQKQLKKITRIGKSKIYIEPKERGKDGQDKQEEVINWQFGACRRNYRSRYGSPNYH